MKTRILVILGLLAFFPVHLRAEDVERNSAQVISFSGRVASPSQFRWIAAEIAARYFRVAGFNLGLF